MNWYYVEQGQQAGPVSEEQLDEMLRSGKIQPDTLVWREGLTNWMPCREARAEVAATGAAGTVTEATPEAVCAECGKIFPMEETIRYGNVHVCAACKPVFLQKLQEGVSWNTGELNYASFGTRFAAYFLDVVILGAFNVSLNLLAGLGATRAVGAESRGVMLLPLILMAVEVLVAICYESLLVGKYGATLGKMALKIKVVTADGGRVSYPRAFGRYFAKMLSGFTCLIGFIIAAFDNPQRRALHDYICNTRVVYK
jgi:uncharacterized RDD family membrane protein YckC